MPNRDPLATPTDQQPRGPSRDGPLPDRSTENPPTPPILDPGDTRNPNDPTLKPALMPIGDPAGMA